MREPLKVRPRSADVEQFWLRQPFPYFCMYCFVHVSRSRGQNHPRRATIEHIKPLSEGGTNRLNNLGVACRKCNAKRAAKR